MVLRIATTRETAAELLHEGNRCVSGHPTGGTHYFQVSQCCKS
jgi:hypothetical protein